jgi:hypothetical protein
MVNGHEATPHPPKGDFHSDCRDRTETILPSTGVTNSIVTLAAGAGPAQASIPNTSTPRVTTSLFIPRFMRRSPY